MLYVTVRQELRQHRPVLRGPQRGRPVVLVHGYPVTGHAWEKQEAALLASDHRFITYDRRGFGSSSQPSVGYHYDTFTADLDALLTKLDLQEVTLVGLSMGTGEVTRYLGAYGSQPVSKAVLVAPLLLKTADNPVGLGQSLFDGFMAACHEGRPAWMKGFLDNFYNMDVLAGTPVSDQAFQASWNVAVAASAKGSLDCIRAWATTSA